jgi:hypothetical protein
MSHVRVVVRELGKLKPDYSLDFDLPAIPAVGSYISITRPGTENWSEDLVVRHVWWRLHHPETRTVVPSEDGQNGVVKEIVVECDPAIGPYATDAWRETIQAAESRGVRVERFDLERFSVRQRDIPGRS